jgi:predicted Zn-dependent protease
MSAVACLLLLGAAGDPLGDLKAGLRAEQAGDDRAARGLLERAVWEAPRWPLAKIELAQVKLKLGQSLQARQLANDAVRLDGSIPRAWHMLAVADEVVGDARGAEAAETRATALRPDYFEAKQHLAQILWNEGKKESSVQLYEQLAATRPQDSSLLALLATSEEEAGHAPAAEHALRQLAGLQPEVPAWHRRLAQLLTSEGKADDAAAELRKMEKLSGSRRKTRHLRPLQPSKR